MERLLALAILIPLSVQAQEQSPQVRALSQRIIAELQSNLACTTQAETLADKLRTVEAEVKRLTDKYEPKPEPKKE